MHLNNHSKIMIIGTSGSGKSSLARKLAAKLQVIDIELDALYWKENWTGSEPEEFRQKIIKVTQENPGFVIHGNYNKVRDLTWGSSKLIIWLDYSKSLVMWRVFKRSVLRILKGETLWAGNQESFHKTFLSKESIIRWAWTTYDVRKKQYEDFIKSPDFKDLKLVRFKKPSEAANYLSSIK